MRAVAPGRLLLVDGFAGPGRYVAGEPGSPLLMLEALMTHSERERFDDVEFMYVFIERDRRRAERLEAEIAARGSRPPNVNVRIENGEFERTFGALVDEVTDDGRIQVPTFAFIDPFGYSTASMSLTGRLLAFPRCEVLIFLPLTFIHRFVGRAGQEDALTSVFGCEDWRAAVDMQGEERRDFLLGLFERQLAANQAVKHVRSFQLRTQDGNDYRLVFGVGHDRGLDLAKDAMWKVDPVGGTSYVATTETGQEVLFSLTVDTGPLLNALRAKFGTEWFTIASAEEYTRLNTPFRVEHLRRRTLSAGRKGRASRRRPREGHPRFRGGTLTIRDLTEEGSSGPGANICSYLAGTLIASLRTEGDGGQKRDRVDRGDLEPGHGL